MEKSFIQLQLFNGVTGEAPTTGAAPATPQTAPATPAQSAPVTPSPGTAQLPPPTGGVVPSGGDRPDSHQMRSALQSAEQTWRQQNAAALELAAELQKAGRDPNQILQQVRERQRQQQIAQQTGLNPQEVDPRLFNTLGTMQDQVQQLQAQYQRDRGMQLLQQMEAETTTFGQQYGIDYNDPQVQQSVRQYAMQNNMDIKSAFTQVYFQQILDSVRAGGQTATMNALQGRGQNVQPLSSAGAGTAPAGPVDWRTVPREQWEAKLKELQQGR